MHSFRCIPTQHVPAVCTSNTVVILPCVLQAFDHIFFPFLEQLYQPEGKAWATRYTTNRYCKWQWLRPNLFFLNVDTLQLLNLKLPSDIINGLMGTPHRVNQKKLVQSYPESLISQKWREEPHHFLEIILSNALTILIVYFRASDRIASLLLQVYFPHQPERPEPVIIYCIHYIYARGTNISIV